MGGCESAHEGRTNFSISIVQCTVLQQNGKRNNSWALYYIRTIIIDDDLIEVSISQSIKINLYSAMRRKRIGGMHTGDTKQTVYVHYMQYRTVQFLRYA